MEGFKPGPECAECRGRCCREKGCSLSPEDMQAALERRQRTGQSALLSQKQQGGYPADKLREQLLTMLSEQRGLYAIDCFSGKEGLFYYLRMRHKCYTFIGVDAIGECIALTKKGCRLSEEERPKGGRFLESRENRQCVQHYTREEMCEDWAPYQAVLSSIWTEYYDRFSEDGTFEKCDADYFAWMKEQRTL